MGKRIEFVPGNRAGIKMDPNKAGIIEIRPGTYGIDLGEKRYALAYIRVLDENHYFKGMCLYSDDLPDGYDVIYYYASPSSGLKALKTDTLEVTPDKCVMTKIPFNNYSGWEGIYIHVASEKLF